MQFQTDTADSHLGPVYTIGRPCSLRVLIANALTTRIFGLEGAVELENLLVNHAGVPGIKFRLLLSFRFETP